MCDDLFASDTATARPPAMDPITQEPAGRLPAIGFVAVAPFW